jgi:single-stranded-DNA-specific exonuclease
MKKWQILSKQNDLKTSEEIINELLLNRQIKTKKEKEAFLYPRLSDISLSSVDLDKKTIDKALKRIFQAIEKNETIVIYGDYDVDGVTGTAILWETLYATYKNVIPYIPDRISEGYGLSIKGIENLISQTPNIKLIITVDNGIVARDAVEFANENDIDVIITDHHVRGKADPKAHTIVHTTQLCGAGVAYMLSRQFDGVSLEENKKQLELVALATIADLVPLTGANRVFAKFGIQELNKTTRPGLLELFKIAGIENGKIGPYHIGFIIGPRINAMGRIATGMDSLRFICTNSSQRAKDLAAILDDTNKDRQFLTEEAAVHAKEIFARLTNHSKIVFVADKEYNQGIIGLVASRLVEEYYRPSFVMSVGEEFSKGSARSVKGINIIELIRSASTYLVEAGGHPMAAGFTVKTAEIELFKKELEEKANGVVTDGHLQKTLEIDISLSLDVISEELYKDLYTLAPFGMANAEPLFVTHGVTVADMRLLGKNRNHAKFIFEKDGKMFEGMYFSFLEKCKIKDKIKINSKLNIAYTIDINEWNGRRKICLQIRDMQ